MKKMAYLLIGFGILVIGLGIVIYLAMFKFNQIGKLVILSSDFKNNEYISAKCTCDGLNLIPKLLISDIPANAKSLAIIIDDPDAPKETWVHFLAWNIKTNGKTSITLFDDNKDNYEGFSRGLNSFNELSWGGPCPPKGHGNHRYYFKVYALNIENLDLKEGTDKEGLLDAMAPYNLSFGEIIGLYKRD